MAGTETPDADRTPQARHRLAAVRSTLPAGATLPGDAVPEAVWEDATLQLAGMLRGLAALQARVPALALPPIESEPPPEPEA